LKLLDARDVIDLTPANNSVTANLDAVVFSLEEWARQDRGLSTETVISLAMWFRKHADGALRTIGDDAISALARTAPRFFSRLRDATGTRFGNLLGAGSPVRSTSSALALLECTWGVPEVVLGLPSVRGESVNDYERVLELRGSNRRSAKQNRRAWVEDPSTYAACLEGARAGRGDSQQRPGRVTSYGQLGGGAHATKAVVLHVSVGSGLAPKAVVRVSPDTLSEDAEPKPATAGVTVRSRSAGQSKRRSGALRAGDRHRAIEFLGSSPAASEVRRLIQVSARCDYPVLILGETGCGKELVARSIHEHSRRASQGIVVADCGTTVESLLQSELFGHEKGAFTGAHASRLGYIAQAHGSTLFLDEVDSMSLRMQAALLRVLESGEYRPVGAGGTAWSDFRLISAAFPNLDEKVGSGEFRRDLYYRVSTLCILIPPLRERVADSTELAIAYARAAGLGISTAALREIDSYDWPGNVRQLQHCLDAAALYAEGRVIGAGALATAIGAYGLRERPARAGAVGREPAESAWRGAVEALGEMEEFAAWDFSRIARVSRRSAQRFLARLVTLGRIEKLGAGRATRYRVAGGRRAT
jgi:DNA-binding NtrC family response regulator